MLGLLEIWRGRKLSSIRIGLWSEDNSLRTVMIGGDGRSLWRVMSRISEHRYPKWVGSEGAVMERSY